MFIARIGQKSLHLQDDSLVSGLYCSHMGRNTMFRMKPEKADLQIVGENKSKNQAIRYLGTEAKMPE